MNFHPINVKEYTGNNNKSKFYLQLKTFNQNDTQGKPCAYSMDHDESQ